MEVEATWGSDAVLAIRFYAGDNVFQLELEPTDAVKLYTEIRREIQKGLTIKEMEAIGMERVKS